MEDLFRAISPARDSNTMMDCASHLAECAFLALRDEKQPPGSRHANASAYARRAIEAFEKAAEDKQNFVATMNFAWFLMTCPVPELRDAHRSVRLIRAVTGRSPPVQNSWGVLGTASYYCDDFSGAVLALEKERRLSPPDFGIWDYYMAMIHWRQGAGRSPGLFRPRRPMGQGQRSETDTTALAT